MTADRLDENEVIDAVVAWLRERGVTAKPPLRTHERGIDIKAFGNGENWFVEAKGGTSSKKGSARYEAGFGNGQLKIHVARAFYTASRLRCAYPGAADRVAIALPDLAATRQAVEAVSCALHSLRITVLWVSPGPVVTEVDQGADVP